MGTEEPSDSHRKILEERIRSHHKERGASLRGLRRLHLFVNEGQSRVPFDEHPTEPVNRIIVVSSDSESESRVEAFHRERMGFVREAVQIVEEQLREAGITLLSREEWLKTPGRPRLVLKIDLGEPKKGASFSARLSVEQEVQMVRDPSVKAAMTTWEKATMKRQFKHGGVSQVFGDLLHNFLHFYRVANDMEDERDRLHLS